MQDDPIYTVKVMDRQVKLSISISTSYSHPTTFTAFGGGAKVPSDYRPTNSVICFDNLGRNVQIAVRSDGNVERRTFGSSTPITSTLYSTVEWTI